MTTFDFTIIANGLTPEDERFADRFFEAGCDDATISFQKGVIILEFDREAKTFFHALFSAIKDVSNAGATVTHIEPDHFVVLRHREPSRHNTGGSFPLRQRVSRL